MNNQLFDVIIIGAGPSGAVAASMLAIKGWRVLVLEKQLFPRFSIGESLLPQCMVFLEKAELDKKLHEQANLFGFQPKHGAAFYKGGTYTEFNFAEKFSIGPSMTYQVKRAEFDQLLADGAVEKGVEIRYQHQVLAIDFNNENPILEVLNEHQQKYKVAGRYLLDASGFGRVLPRLLQLEKPSSFPVRQSYFAHFTDGIIDQTFDRNKILISVHPEHHDVWYWTIPFADGTTSVGVVGKPEQFPSNQQSAEQILLSYIQQTPNLKKLLANAQLANQVQTISGYSADVTTLYGDQYALLGNAGEFLDPIFSSGVTIALYSATLVTPLIDDYLQGKPVDFEQQFVKPLTAGVNCFKTFVSGWYDGGFQDVIFTEKHNNKIREMICSILAGYAWDQDNPYVKESERRLNTLVDLCHTATY